MLELEESVYGFPIERDLKSVAISILRLWPFYRLDVNDLVDGIVKDTQTDRLESSEILYIANVAEEQQMYYEEITWLKRLVELMLSGEREKKGMEQIIVCKKLARSYFSVRMMFVLCLYLHIF